MQLKVTVISDKSDTSPLGEAVTARVVRNFEENGVAMDVYRLQLEDLHHCAGCFGCWLKTPGVCLFNDPGRDICKSIIQSNLAVFVSPVKFGCYSPVIRRVWDRLLPNILPFFIKVNGEVHHAPRYRKYPDLVVFGTGDNISAHEEETFKSLTDANAINFMTRAAHTYICRREPDITTAIRSFNTYVQERKAVG